MATVRDVDFRQIRTLEGRQDVAFEEFCCQIARRTKDVPHGSRFMRYRGAGGDGGVECIWALPNGEEWGWQAKYFFQLDKRQLDNSVETALTIHPALTRYYICVPFDFTGPTARSGKSELEKFDEYVQEWQLLAESRGMQVEFIRLDRSGLLDQLLEFDPHGGRLRFWFDIERFGNQWFSDHLAQTTKAAEPRYTPKLSVDVPVVAAFEALGRTERWEQAVFAFIRRLGEARRDWSRSLGGADWTGDEVEFPEAAKEPAERLWMQLDVLTQGLGDLLELYRENDLIARLESVVVGALELAAKCHMVAKEALETRYGKGMADSVVFRHHMAEYEARFPASHVDASRDVMGILEELRGWLRSPEAHLPLSSAMLLLGPAGIGKTHSVCAIANDRHERKLRSVLLLGERFNHITGEPWERMRSLVGLGSDFSEHELFEILDAAGECTGYPCIIFVDALNDTVPRRFWYDCLSSLVDRVGRHRWLRLCASCRTTYCEDVRSPNVQIPHIEHTGFAGIEFDACVQFFDFYDLEPPSMPLMQPEFCNPLFLRLVCESLQVAEVKYLTAGTVGIARIIHELVKTKNETLSKVLDYHPREGYVPKALDLLLSEMQRRKTVWLPWHEAKRLVDAIWPSLQRSTSLFDHLLREELIREDRVLDPVTGETKDVILVSFERIADYLLADKYLAGMSRESVHGVFLPGGILSFTVRDEDAVRENRGLLEALAVLLPEKYGVELPEVIGGKEPSSQITIIVMESLAWRVDGSFGRSSERIIRKALTEPKAFAVVVEALLALSTRVDNPFNARWFHHLLASFSMVERDAALCPFLHESFGKRRGLDRLLQWALDANLQTVSTETAELWTIQLCWFCAASDRRVRDYATKAMVRLMEHYPVGWSQVIRRFSQVDDEYVLERCLAAAYGTLIRTDHNPVTRAVAATVFEIFFENGLLPQNAVVRDYARLILEFAACRNSLPGDVTAEQFRPPYESPWPPEWPDVGFAKQYQDTYWELPKLCSSCFHDDFATYTAPYALRALEDSEIPQALRWIFKHVLDMGYTRERFAGFDAYLLHEYGPGRSKPVWAERIGKKYQWIALYRLLACVADHVHEKQSDWSPPPTEAPRLQAQDERNIDPTLLLKREKRAYAVTWWAPVDYDFQAVALLPDDAWLDRWDFPDSSRMLKVTDRAGQNEWFVLQAFLQWTSEHENQGDRLPYREIWMHMRSYLVHKEDVGRCWHWLPRQDFMGRWMPEGFDIHGGFLGEYPWGLPFVHFFELARSEGSYDAYESSRLPCRMVPTAHAVQCAYEYDAYQEGGMGILVPAQEFFKDGNLIWNADSGYVSESDTLCFNYPATHEAGPSALLADKQYLLSFLEENELALAWTVLSEKQCVHDIQSHELGYSKHSRGHMIVDGKTRNTRGITARVRPTG